MKIHEATEQAYKNGYEDGFKDGYDGGLDVGKRHAMDWIPVTERLPETTCTNLVSCGEVMFLAYYDGKQWRSSGTLRVVPVKHWMPLPEPPKEGTT